MHAQPWKPALAALRGFVLIWSIVIFGCPYVVESEMTVEEQLVAAQDKIRRLESQLQPFLGESAALEAEERANDTAAAAALAAAGQVVIVDSNTGLVHVESANNTDVGALLQSTTTAAPTVIIQGHSVPLKVKEMMIVIGLLACMAGIFVVPLLPPFRRCLERCFHRIYPVIALIDVALFLYVMSSLHTITVNDLFFTVIAVLEIVIDSAETVLTAVVLVFLVLIAWKFKDRVLIALGVDNPLYFIGDIRDWATCWSMRRFHPIELQVLKVENIPAAKLHSHNDLYVEVALGYNLNTRTRVHARVGHRCVFKEKMQLNFDPYDGNAKLRISVMNQEVIFPSEIASVQLGANKVAQFEEGSSQDKPSMTATASPDLWDAKRFMPIDLIPSGTIYLRFQAGEESKGGPCSCCFPDI